MQGERKVVSCEGNRSSTERGEVNEPGEGQVICDSGHAPWSWGRCAPKYLYFFL